MKRLACACVLSLAGFFIALSFGAKLPDTPAPTTLAATTATSQLAPVPLLTPEEEIETFNLRPGYRAEVVACEPMVEHPVFMTFDAKGRIWVAEMRSYMPDTSGWRENAPTGRISVLEDTDSDGRMDKSTIFLDKLVLPRAIGFSADGVLIGTPPNLYLCHDKDGDLKADDQIVVDDKFAVVGNPENFANGLMWGIDNWIYCSDHDKRMRANRDGTITIEPLPVMGQWGITRDDWGRMYFNTNSDYLRGAMIPPHYVSRNPLSSITIADVKVAKDQTVWPAHASTENRGYRDGLLRPDGTLKEFTAACAPMIYRGDLFKDAIGNAFVCEASANLVRRAVLTEKDGVLSAANAYDGREFIASTYERFRPVCLQTGPDGAIYLVDMHHGLIQHKMSLTEYGKQQYMAKQLNKHLKTGRIFRIVPEGGAPPVKVDLENSSTDELVNDLTHANGWYCDTAQRLLVSRGDSAAVALLQNLAKRGVSPVHRVNALWTLDGTGITAVDIKTALQDEDEHVRTQAVRLAENHWGDPSMASLFDDALKLQRDKSMAVRVQLALSAGNPSAPDEEKAFTLFRDYAGNTSLRQAAVSGLAKRELKFLGWLSQAAGTDREPRATRTLFTAVAQSLTRRHEDAEMAALVDLIATVPADRSWQQAAMLDAISGARRDPFGTIKLIEVPQKPAAIETIASSKDKDVSGAAEKVDALFVWPGKPMPPRPKVEPLTADEQRLYDIGKQQFALVCAQCHQPNGLGQLGKAPALVNSPWVLGSDKRLIRIVLHGMRGEIEVGEQKFNLDMPSWAALTDEQIAGSLTYIRRTWGHEAPPVKVTDVASTRDWGQSRRDGWTQEELLQIK